MAEARRPLEGIRVIDLSSYIFGPAAAAVLSDFGAEVIKIENPVGGDPYRNLPQTPPMPVSEMNYCWILDNRNKKGLALNLAKEEGREAFLKLVSRADVLITNLSAPILKRFRIAYEDVSPLNERLIFAHITGYGDCGEDCEKPGFDTAGYWARSGLMEAVRAADSDPAFSTAGMGDHPSSMAMFGAVMLALYNRDRTGRGTKISSSLMANGAWANSCSIQAAACGATFYEKRPRTNALNAMINHYTAQDGRRFLLVSLRPDDWKSVCRAIEQPELTEDSRFVEKETRKTNMSQFIAILDEAFARHDLPEWERRFKEHDVIFSHIQTSEEAARDRQMEANGVFLECDHPRHGKLRVVNSPFELRGVEKVKPCAAPELGEHTSEVLRSVGYDEAGIAKLKAVGAI